MVVWEFKTRGLIVRYSAEDSDFFAADLEPKLAKSIRGRLQRGTLVCFTAIISVHLATGEELTKATLGQCIYKNYMEFRDHIGIKVKSRKDGRNYGSYFSDMVRETVEVSRGKLLAIQKIKVKA